MTAPAPAAPPPSPEGPTESPPGAAYGSLGCGIVGLFSLPYPAIAVSSALIGSGHRSPALIVLAGLLFGLPTVALGVHGLRQSKKATPYVAIAGIVLGVLTSCACIAAGLFGLALTEKAGR